MRGDDRVRFCQQCKMNVYDISAMSRADATQLIASHEGRLCVQMYRRSDGTVITDDCGLIRKTARRAAHFATTAASVVLCAALSPLFLWSSDRTPARSTQASFVPMDVFERCFLPLTQWLQINQARGGVSAMPTPITGAPIMGDVAIPTTQPTTQPTESGQHLMGKIAPATQPTEDKDNC